MVKSENIEVDLAAARASVTAAQLIRNEAGVWTLVLDIDGEIKIDSVRSVRVEGTLRMRGRQKGRKRG